MPETPEPTGEIARALLPLLERATAWPVEHDPDWPSPCVVGTPDADNMVRWRPTPMGAAADFSGIALHADLREFFGSFWGGSPGGRHSGEAVLLRIAWNAEDLARIKEIVAVQIAAGAPVFVAGTDSDWYFGVDNTTGAVWLCEPGRPPMRQVAQRLAAFLAGIE